VQLLYGTWQLQQMDDECHIWHLEDMNALDRCLAIQQAVHVSWSWCRPRSHPSFLKQLSYHVGRTQHSLDGPKTSDFSGALSLELHQSGPLCLQHHGAKRSEHGSNRSDSLNPSSGDLTSEPSPSSERGWQCKKHYENRDDPGSCGRSKSTIFTRHLSSPSMRSTTGPQRQLLPERCQSQC
jgi:hypothetical protein